jgi:hypothetical protein
MFRIAAGSLAPPKQQFGIDLDTRWLSSEPSLA